MQKNKIGIFVILLLVAGLSYYFLQDGKQDETEVSVPVSPSENPDMTVDQDTLPPRDKEELAADADTAPDNSSENTEMTTNQDTFPSLAGDGLAPGTALISARILSVENGNESHYRMKLQVNEVLGYGSSTPVLASDNNLVVDATRFFKKNIKLKGTIEDNTEIKVVISYQKGMSMGEESAEGQWKLQEITKQ